jgi:hypothetical protein
VADEVGTFLRREEAERSGDEGDDLVEAARPCRAEERLQFRKRELDGIEIGTVRRQKSQVRPGAFDGGPHGGLLVHDEVVEHHDVPGLQGGDQHLLDIGEKGRIIDRPIEHRGRAQTGDPQRQEHGVGLPVATRRVVAESQAARTPPVTAQEICGYAGFIDEDIPAGIAEGQGVLPVPARGRDVSAALFVGVDRFF